MQDSSQTVDRKPPGKTGLVSGALALCLIGLWTFPSWWYRQSGATAGAFWLQEQTQVPGWTFVSLPVAKVAEKVLVADRLFSGEFTRSDGRPIRVFSAKRYEERPHDIGLFVHTPDRCWTEAGWQIKPVRPEVQEVALFGHKLILERRVFVQRDHAELVYFGGLVGGQSLPYRLDHNLSVGTRQALHVSADRTSSRLRASDQRLWTYVWESFRERRPLFGPKQFIRISTPFSEDGTGKEDELLTAFLSEWLVSADYQTELAAWRTSASRD